MQIMNQNEKAELRLSEDRLYGAATQHYFVVNNGIKKTEFLWVHDLYSHFTLSGPLSLLLCP